ncbi:MAG: hypothetical protein ABSC51_02660 [Gaiellaceae bacterium]|jgi:hypothetical protein
MNLCIPWLVFPLLLALLTIGCGLLVETVAGRRLPAPLVLPVGLAMLIVAASFATEWAASARLAVPLVIVLTVAGFGLSDRWHKSYRRGRSAWAFLVALASYAVYSAPVVLSGQASFAGYMKLDDTATYLALVDRAMEHGRSLAGLAPSTYEATLSISLAIGYPLGSLLPLGIGHELLRTDSAWLWQPQLSFLAAMLALALYVLAAPLVRPRPLRALVAFVAAQPAILFGYALWGGVKELTAAVLLPTLAVLVVAILRQGGGLRELLAPAVVCAALLDALSLPAAVWLLPVVGLAVAMAIVRVGWRRAAVRTTVLGAAAAALAIPAIVAAFDWLGHTQAFTSTGELGNLLGPLSRLQVFGIWLHGDFRTPPASRGPTYILIGIAAAAALLGLVLAWRKRALKLLLYVLGALVACAVFVEAGSPWIGAKGLATAAPALLLVALAGCTALGVAGWRSGGWHVGAFIVLAAIGGGVVWSNVLAYRDVWLAPRARLSELVTIGDRFAGQGPALMTEYEPFGARHFLRTLDAEAVSSLRWHTIPLRNGKTVAPWQSADLDALRLSGVLYYRTLVLRRSPVASRPPSVYRLVWQGRFYEVWQRPLLPAKIIEHLSLGDALSPGAVPSCADVLALARRVPAGGTLATVVRSKPNVVSLADVAGWRPFPPIPGSAYPLDSRTLEERVSVPAAGRYGVWLGNSFAGSVSIVVDGRALGSEHEQLSWSGQYQPFAEVTLEAGTHTVTLAYRRGGPRPGADSVPVYPLGPLVLARETAARPVELVAPEDARSLCGRTLDWVEAVS